jgi:hypothetical protein
MPRFIACFAVLLIVAALLAVFFGYRKQDEIRHYTVPKQSEVDRLAGSSEESAGPQRMLAAIVLRPSQGWFFKLMGPADAVNLRAEEFAGFLNSLHFQDDAPAWSLPEGWQEEPGNQFRYATLKISDTPLEVSVTTLQRGETDETEYVLKNVNRWRDQLGLSSIAPDELQRETKQVELEGSTATLVDLVGEANGDSMSAPFASGRQARPPVRGASGDAPHLKYQVPEGWQEVPASAYRKASFRITHGGASGEALITDLEPAAGDVLPNVNRWRDQIELGPTTQREIDDHIESISVGDHEGQYIEMRSDKEATFAVIVKAAGRAWFIKLTGDRSLVEQQRDNFKSFVHSLTIGDHAGATDGH